MLLLLFNVVHAVPKPVVTFTDFERIGEIPDFGQSVDGIRQARRIGVALLDADFEVQTSLRVEDCDKARSVHRQAQAGIVDQGVAQKL